MRKFLLPLMMACSLVLSASGCALFLKPPVEDTYARMILGRLTQQNEGLTQFKGLAKVRMTSEGQSRSGRIAFAAVLPDRMRIELLNTMGTPLTSMVGDGKDLSILSHIDKKQYRIRQSRTALEPVIHLPIGIEDLQSLLSGRVPLPPHAFAQSLKADGSEDIVLLKNRWHGLISKLKVNSNTHRILQMEVYGSEGELLYEIQWHQWKEIGGFTLPEKVLIESLAHQSLTLKVDRYWPNAEVAPSTFVLDLSPK